jgi:DNA mismatch repair ATPase MutS
MRHFYPATRRVIVSLSRSVARNATAQGFTYILASFLVIQEEQSEAGISSYGICILDAATGRFELTAFDDDVCRTKLGTLFRQLRPRELVFSKVRVNAL